MAEIVITEQDKIDAETFLEQFLTEAVEGGDFSKGTAIHDYVISGMGNIFAYLLKERDYIKARQSLLLLSSIVGATDVDDAVNEILSNWFLTRKAGTVSRGVASIYFSRNDPVSIPATARFNKTATLVFKPDTSSTSMEFGSDSFTPRVDSTGQVVSYALRVPLVSDGVGEDYNIAAGPFSTYTNFNPYVISVENTSQFSGGGDVETTDEFLDRANTAISVRDLNSARSIDVTLKDLFSDIEDLTVIGYGDAEMIRDLVAEEATNTRIHGGGHVDAFIRSPIVESEEVTAVIGGTFTDPRDGYYILRDPTVSDFFGLGIAEGCMLRIYNNLPTSESQLYVVKAVTTYGVYVSRRSEFPMELPTIEDTFDDGVITPSPSPSLTSTNRPFTADDIGKWIGVYSAANSENVGTWRIYDVSGSSALIDDATGVVDESAVTFNVLTRVVEYSIGDNSGFNNRVGRRISGQFTRIVQEEGMVLLPAKPIYRIRDVSFASTSDPYAVNGRVTFPTRTNTTPTDGGSPDELKYQVICQNPEEAQSGWQVMQLNVGWDTDATRFDGNTLRVTYDTLSGYDAIFAHMTSDEYRIMCGSVIPRGFHPVYLSMNISYSLARRATEGLDTTDAAQQLASYINTFDTMEVMDTSDIMTFLRTTYSVIGYIEPITITYDLIAPDGRVIPYETSDAITIDVAKQTGTVSYDQLPDPLGQGVSNNTVRYLTLPELITFTEVSI